MSKIPDRQKTSVFEAVFDQLSDALVLWDPEFRITGVNRSAERLFGMSSGEMLGKHCQELFQCTRYDPGYGALMGWDMAPSAAHGTVRLNTGNGMERLVAMRTSQIIDGDGQLAVVVATIQVITEKAAPQTHAVIAESGQAHQPANVSRRLATAGLEDPEGLSAHCSLACSRPPSRARRRRG